MGKRSVGVFIVFFSLLLSALSRTLTSTENEDYYYGKYSHTIITTDLDVSASLQRTLEVLDDIVYANSVQQIQEQEEDRTYFNSSSSFSVSLHPRSTLHKPHHPDYQSLTLSRLRRDAARLQFLTTKLHPPVERESLQTPVTSGASLGSGEYFSRVGVGEPPKPFFMVLDTGSDINWLQCQPCSDCYQQSDPLFQPASSSSYSPLSCDSNQCSSLDISACRNGQCLYQVSYGDGSYTIGELATETVSFGASGAVTNVAMGCGHENQGLFVGAAGLLGLGGGSLSLPSQIRASSFSYCLVNRDSSASSTLEFNTAQPSDSVTAPLLRNPTQSTFFYIGLADISVGGRMLSIPPTVFRVDANGNGGIIVDSGTAVTRLQSQAYNSLRDTFIQMTQNLPRASSFALFDTCYDLSMMSRVSVPVVAFHFQGGKTLPLHANNYLIPVDSAGKFCLAFAPTDGTLSIIGNVQQQGTRVSYDLANSMVGFSSDKC